MPSHSVKQAKVMSAIAHGWRPSGLDIPIKVAREFHSADAGHKYGKGMDKKTKALSATKHYRKKYADGGDIPDVGEPLIPSGGEFSPGTRIGNKAADIGSKLAYGNMKSAATLFPRYIQSAVEASKYPVGSEEAREAYGDVGQTTGEMGMNMIGPKSGRPIPGTSGVFVGPYGAHMLRAADREAGRPTIPHPVVEAEIADKAASLRPEFRDIYKGQVQDMRDAEAQRVLATQGLGSPNYNREIHARSGWHRGAEGMAKKEIPDTGAKLVPMEGGKDYEFNEGKISPVQTFRLEHPAGDFH